MISKEEFIQEVEKEISLLNASGQMQKIKEKKPVPLSKIELFFARCFGLGFILCFVWLLILEPEALLSRGSSVPMKENHPILIGVTIFFLVPLLIIGLVIKIRSKKFLKQINQLQVNYEKMLSLLDVKKITDKRFEKFSSGGIYSPAYSLDNFIMQQFINFDKSSNAKMLIYFKTKSVSDQKLFGFRSLDSFPKNTPLYQLGKKLSDHITVEDRNPFAECKGYQKNEEQQISIEFFAISERFIYDTNTPFFSYFLSSKAPYLLFVHQNYKCFAEKLYDEVIRLKELFNQID